MPRKEGIKGDFMIKDGKKETKGRKRGNIFPLKGKVLKMNMTILNAHLIKNFDNYFSN